MELREAPFALRIVRRQEGDAAVVYRRRLTKTGNERLERMASIGAHAFSVGAPLLREAVRAGLTPRYRTSTRFRERRERPVELLYRCLAPRLWSQGREVSWHFAELREGNLAAVLRAARTYGEQVAV